MIQVYLNPWISKNDTISKKLNFGFVSLHFNPYLIHTLTIMGKAFVIIF